MAIQAFMLISIWISFGRNDNTYRIQHFSEKKEFKKNVWKKERLVANANQNSIKPLFK